MRMQIYQFNLMYFHGENLSLSAECQNVLPASLSAASIAEANYKNVVLSAENWVV